MRPCGLSFCERVCNKCCRGTAIFTQYLPPSPYKKIIRRGHVTSRVCCTPGAPVYRVWQRQQARSDNGDDVPYVLVRTVRSNIRNEAAAIALGANGAGNQAVRGECMARALGLLCGKGMGGIPHAVVGALLRHCGSSSLLVFFSPLFSRPEGWIPIWFPVVCSVISLNKYWREG